MATILQTKTINFRLLLVCIAAAAVALPIALISIAKILLLVGGTAILLLERNKVPVQTGDPRLRRTSILILLALLAFAVSVSWTTAPLPEAFSALGKYGKLLMIPLIVGLLRSRREALYALGVFAAAQTFLLLSSWMLFLRLPVPWATSPTALVYHAAFSSYLDESIMSAVFAALCWHLQYLVPSRFGRPIALVVMVLALANVFFVFNGRTGHLAAIAVISLALMWKLPAKARIAAVLLPFLLLFAMYVVSPKVQTRLQQATQEVKAFSFDKGANVYGGTSSGIRLHLWHRAVQSIGESPFAGSGIGSWTNEFNRIEIERAAKPQEIEPLGNPHEEYLLWGVHLGVPGLLLFVGLLLSMLRDSLPMERKTAHAIQSVLAALAVACLFNSIIYDALIGDFFCVTLGLLLALGFHPAEPAAEKLLTTGPAASA